MGHNKTRKMLQNVTLILFIISICVSQNTAFHLNLLNAKKELFSILKLDNVFSPMDNQVAVQEQISLNNHLYQQVNFVRPTTQMTPTNTVENSENLVMTQLKTLYRDDTEDRNFHNKKTKHIKI